MPENCFISNLSRLEAPEARDHECAQQETLRRRLFEARTVLLFGEVTTELAQTVCAQLLALAGQNSEPIKIVLHSQGGHVEAGDTIHDVIRFVPAPVWILGTGWVASAGALIFAAAAREYRFSLPNTRFLLHQPIGGVGGPASDVEIEARQIAQMRRRLNQLFAEATGKPLEKIARDTDRNHWMSAREAVEYGLAGSVVERASQFMNPAPAP